jgi:hypothetical protein
MSPCLTSTALLACQLSHWFSMGIHKTVSSHICALCMCRFMLSAATSSAPFQPWGKPGIVKDSTKSVFVRNLPFESTYEDLASFFSQAGEVSLG